MQRSRRWQRSLCAVITAPLALAACGDGAEVTVEESVPVWTVEGPDLRIGAVDDLDYAFGRVGALAEAPDGTLYSLHPQEVEIRRWSAEGVPSGFVGREGEGPGEFVGPRTIGFFGDSLWVMDSRAYRVTYFDLKGSFLGSTSPTVDIGSREMFPNDPARPERPLRDGTFHASAPGWSEEISTGELTESPHAHLAQDGSTITHFWDRPWMRRDILALPNAEGVGGMYMPQPFGDDVLTAASDHGLLVVERRVWEEVGGAAVTMTMITFTGDTLWQRSVPYEPVSLLGQRADSTTAATAQRIFDLMSRRRPSMTLATLERRLGDATYVPAYVPFVRRVLLSREGQIWLEVFERVEGGVGWLVFGAQGDPLARVVLPLGFELSEIRGSSLWGIERDDLDVEYIVRYRVR